LRKNVYATLSSSIYIKDLIRHSLLKRTKLTLDDMESAIMNPVVKTQHGELRGHFANGVFIFKGIPYAAPPFGKNRLLPPQPVEPWHGVRDALDFGPKAPQPVYPLGMDQYLPPELTSTGENCLTLNIFSPELGSAKLPVMVWIAGGLFEYHGTGASPWYDGSRFAQDGVVLISINYRVGAEGFLFLREGNANRGLLDQIAALEWIHENIAAFGGNPSNVTIFGESAGAMSVCTLLAVPRAEGLFRRAISQSGSSYHVTTLATAHLVSQSIAQRLGVEATREAIASVPIDRLLFAQEELKAEIDTNPSPERWGELSLNLLPYEPVIDGNILPDRPIDRIISGASADVDLLVGTNMQENRLFLVASGAIEHITNEALASVVTAYGLPVEVALSTYRGIYPDASAGDLLAAIQGDWYWRIPTIRMAEAHAKNTSATYLYEFAWRSPQFNGRLGACHALDIPFVFDTLGNNTAGLLGTNPPQTLADTMHAAWVYFATHGDPGWPKYNLEQRAAMRFDTVSKLVYDPLSQERTLWVEVR
jgi:para-nitrobenzyl esterase